MTVTLVLKILKDCFKKRQILDQIHWSSKWISCMYVNSWETEWCFFISLSNELEPFWLCTDNVFNPLCLKSKGPCWYAQDGLQTKIQTCKIGTWKQYDLPCEVQSLLWPSSRVCIRALRFLDASWCELSLILMHFQTNFMTNISWTFWLRMKISLYNQNSHLSLVHVKTTLKYQGVLWKWYLIKYVCFSSC